MASIAPVERWQIGDARITRVVELSIPTPAEMLFVGSNPDMLTKHTWIRPDFADDDGNLFQFIQCFIIESCGQRIVVDTCVGNDKTRPVEFLNQLNTRFLQNFRGAGFAPETIDFVLCTHLHLDHVGWNTMLLDGKWVPTFPNARYLFGRVDWSEVSAPGYVDPMGDILSDSLKPIVDAGLCDFVDTNHVVNDEISLVPTPGHTAGHVSVQIRSGRQEAVITGDMIHHPLQCGEPQLYSHFCADPERSTATRRDFLSRVCGTETVVIGSHFAGWTAGRIQKDGQAYRFVRLNNHHNI